MCTGKDITREFIQLFGLFQALFDRVVSRKSQVATTPPGVARLATPGFLSWSRVARLATSVLKKTKSRDSENHFLYCGFCFICRQLLVSQCYDNYYY